MLSYCISYSDDLQIYTYWKQFLDIGFKANKIHLKIGCFFFGPVYFLNIISSAQYKNKVLKIILHS